MDNFNIKLPSKLCYLNAVAYFFKECLMQSEKLRDNPQLIYDLELVLSEAMTNAIKYPLVEDAPSIIILNISINDNQIEIAVTDFGKGFDIGAIPEPNFDEFQEGGYGIFIIKSKMDYVAYTINGKSGNTLLLRKKFI